MIGPVGPDDSVDLDGMGYSAQLMPRNQHSTLTAPIGTRVGQGAPRSTDADGLLLGNRRRSATRRAMASGSVGSNVGADGTPIAALSARPYRQQTG
jgi:hypothetical protein